uniref:Uncharacterized protein n=1 Tax=Oryza punctata TaxID=4537 RepID=A0A0E0LT67_ORYPU
MGVTSRPYSHFPSSPPPGRPRRRGSRPGLLRWVNYLQHNVKRSKFTSKELLQNPCLILTGALPVCNLISSASLQHSIADTSPLVPMPWLLQAQNQSISETTITATSDKRCRCEVQRL